MIWVTWAQHRREALISGLVLAATGCFLLITGLNMAADFVRSGYDHCVYGPQELAGRTSCDAIQGFPGNWGSLTTGADLAFILLPAVFGVFVAAPLLSREFEQRTNFLAWSQSITRLRWTVIKLGLLIACVLIAAAALAIAVTWWRRPMDLASYNGRWSAFDVEGLAPVAYAVFAFAIGTLAGLLVRLVIPAMALTFFAFAGVRLIVELIIRPHFARPVTGLAMNLPRGSWVINPNYYVDAHGQLLSFDQVNGVMTRYNGTSEAGLVTYMQQHGIRLLADYQPPDRFWTFQFIEAAIFLGLAILLIGVTLWWLQRRA